MCVLSQYVCVHNIVSLISIFYNEKIGRHHHCLYTYCLKGQIANENRGINTEP